MDLRVESRGVQDLSCHQFHTNIVPDMVHTATSTEHDAPVQLVELQPRSQRIGLFEVGMYYEHRRMKYGRAWLYTAPPDANPRGKRVRTLWKNEVIGPVVSVRETRGFGRYFITLEVPPPANVRTTNWRQTFFVNANVDGKNLLIETTPPH